MDLMQITTTLIAGAGALAVFALMIPESAGVPVPSEAVMMAAGFAVQQGHMELWMAIAAGTGGNIVGSLIAYWIGRRGLLKKLPGKFGAKTQERCEAMFATKGQRAVFFARLLPLARTFISLPAGHARVPLGDFVAMTAAGCALWSTLFVSAGLIAGEGWVALSATLDRYALWIVAAVILVWWGARRLSSRRGSVRSMMRRPQISDDDSGNDQATCSLAHGGGAMLVLGTSDD